MSEENNDSLSHYGTPRHSGRYPWGSGKNPQRNKDVLGRIDDLKAKGLTEKQIADSMGLSVFQLRAQKTIANEAYRKAEVAEAERLKAKGMSNVAIGKQMGINESSVRSLLNPSIKARQDQTVNAANALEEAIAKKTYIDIGPGLSNYLGVSDTKSKVAIEMLKEKGYNVYYLKTPQLGTGKFTTTTVLAAPGKTYKDLAKDPTQVKLLADYVIKEDGKNDLGLKPINSISSSRVKVRYADDTDKDGAKGIERDGVIQIRRGCPDLDLGESRYAQVRIAVDGTHYLKGMAMYADDDNFPKGVDIVFNTNKKDSVPMLGPKDNTVLKPMKEDPDNPFGSSIIQKEYTDPKTGEVKVSALNIVGSKFDMSDAHQEGGWSTWSKSLSSQFLSKQTPQLAKKQLDLAYQQEKEEYDEIMALTNPVIKKRLLKSFSDQCDADAVDLKGAALPRQASKVILPFPDLKDNQIYAPGFKEGEEVALVRYPHGGTFEIPVLTVKNKGTEADRLIHNAQDAVGINFTVAQQLSGADFDGDTVLVIPMTGNKIKAQKAVKKLVDFDPKEMPRYQKYPGMKVMSKKQTQIEMGKVSNLITDMTLKGADKDEIYRAVKHSMVVIDANKHELNYKQSEKDFNIKELKDKYQDNNGRHGASTIISRAKSDVRVPLRTDYYKIDPETGERIWNTKPDKERYYTKYSVGSKKVVKDKKEPGTYIIPATKNSPERKVSYKELLDMAERGEVKATRAERQTKTTAMDNAKDAYTLTSGGSKDNVDHPMEAIYADHANRLKALANQARKDEVAIKSTPRSSAAAKTYSAEVASLMAKLNEAQKNKPLERQAQALANSYVKAQTDENPDLSGKDLKKVKNAALRRAREKVGAKKPDIQITDREWEAIQAHAITDTTLNKILDATDQDRVRQLATPRDSRSISTSQQSRIRRMMDSGDYTMAEIAEAVGVSTSTITKVMNNEV